MTVSDSFRDLVVDQLSRVAAPIRARRMFGGVGIYGGDLFFALIAGDTLYFKTDPSTRPDFEARGMLPFRPGGDAGGTMSYHAVPEEVLEDPDALREWASRALDVARRAHTSKRKGR